MKNFNQLLKELREDKKVKLSQAQVGAECGISQRKLSFIEKGVTEPNLQDLRALCLYYGVSADYLLGLPKDLNYPEE